MLGRSSSLSLMEVGAGWGSHSWLSGLDTKSVISWGLGLTLRKTPTSC